MLLRIEEIERQLHEKFAPFEEEMDDLILKKRTSPIIDTIRLEHDLGIKLPDDFVNFIKTYNVDNFSMGNISLGSSGDYISQIIQINRNNFNHWWSGDSRPKDSIVIAITDPYSIILNTKDCKIYAITSEESPRDKEPVAAGFLIFLRCVGSIFLKACSRDEAAIYADSKNNNFWDSI